MLLFTDGTEWRKLMHMTLLRIGLALLALFGSAMISIGCSKPKTDVQYGDPVSVRLTAGGGRPELEMALALAGGQGEPAPNVTADVLFQVMKGCPDVDSLAKNGQVVRLRLKVRGEAFHPAETPSDALSTCVAKAIEGAPFAGKKDEFDALAEIRAAVSKEHAAKGAKE